MQAQQSALFEGSRLLDAPIFASKYPRPYVVVGRIDPDVTSKSRRAEDHCLPLLMAAVGIVGNVGECSGTVQDFGWTVRLSFARGDDAARFCAFLRATPVPNGADSIFMASFRLDRRLYADLLEARDREQGRHKVA